MEVDLSNYINPRGHERIDYDILQKMEPGTLMRLHFGEVRAYVSFDHPGTDVNRPFVKLENVTWTRDKAAYVNGKIIDVDRLNLFSMPSS